LLQRVCSRDFSGGLLEESHDRLRTLGLDEASGARKDYPAEHLFCTRHFPVMPACASWTLGYLFSSHRALDRHVSSLSGQINILPRLKRDRFSKSYVLFLAIPSPARVPDVFVATRHGSTPPRRISVGLKPRISPCGKYSSPHCSRPFHIGGTGKQDGGESGCCHRQA
jgi:hypothetical protein